MRTIVLFTLSAAGLKWKWLILLYGRSVTRDYQVINDTHIKMWANMKCFAIASIWEGQDWTFYGNVHEISTEGKKQNIKRDQHINIWFSFFIKTWHKHNRQRSDDKICSRIRGLDVSSSKDFSKFMQYLWFFIYLINHQISNIHCDDISLCQAKFNLGRFSLY